ncbi:MAG: zinc ribbon domain-containing protein, partial [Anaerolineales bacterium]|nr:zinc ribbon domain-containing protein [Anaerolineales bacterium]
DYAVEAFSIKLQEPVDTVSLTSEPALEKSQENGTNIYSNKPVSLAAGEQFTLNLHYEKSSDALTVPESPVQTSPIDETTSGRIPLNSYLPYILGGLGAILIVGGLVYYFLSGRERGQKPRRRNRSPSDSESNTSAAHCHQCGTRTKPGDRFCRVCGTRLRKDESSTTTKGGGLE